MTFNESSTPITTPSTTGSCQGNKLPNYQLAIQFKILRNNHSIFVHQFSQSMLKVTLDFDKKKHSYRSSLQWSFLEL